MVTNFIHLSCYSSSFAGNIEDPEEVLEWLQKHKTSSSIEEVTDEILMDLVESHEYVGVYFKVPLTMADEIKVCYNLNLNFDFGNCPKGKLHRR